jgi:hypothetical protein
MASFGIPVEEPLEAGGKPKGAPVSLSLSADPDFGPIWRFHRSGGESILRLTPLTDLDIAGVIEKLQLPPGCGLAETLGRLTQLVEELPWIHAMEAEIQAPQDPAEARPTLPLSAGLHVAFTQAEFRMS